MRSLTSMTDYLLCLVSFLAFVVTIKGNIVLLFKFFFYLLILRFHVSETMPVVLHDGQCTIQGISYSDYQNAFFF